MRGVQGPQRHKTHPVLWAFSWVGGWVGGWGLFRPTTGFSTFWYQGGNQHSGEETNVPKVRVCCTFLIWHEKDFDPTQGACP